MLGGKPDDPGGGAPMCPALEAFPCINLTTPITSKMAGQVLPKPTRETLSSRNSTPRVISIAGPMSLRVRQCSHWHPTRVPPIRPHCLAKSHTPRKIRMSGQKRSRPNSNNPAVCNRKSTPKPIRTAAPAGTLVPSNFSPAPKVCQGLVWSRLAILNGSSRPEPRQ